MKKIKHIVTPYVAARKALAVVLLAPMLLASCVKEQAGTDERLSEEKEVILKVAVPFTGNPSRATRSISVQDENTIRTMDVLAFRVDGGVERFEYYSEAVPAPGNAAGASSQSFVSKLRVKDFPQRFVLITNARQKVRELASRVEWRNAEKEAMLAQLTFALSDQGGGDRWQSISSANYSAIPMWGQSEQLTLDGSTTTIGSIAMLRMVAKIEVQLWVDPSDPQYTTKMNALKAKFKLRSVHLYNTHTTGCVVPNTAATHWDATGRVALRPTVPSAAATVLGPLAYTDFLAPGTKDVAMKGAIYTFERAARNLGDRLDETCLVVGGLYQNDVAQTYYRLDFFAADGATHLDILRNHNYICNIVGVTERGNTTPDDAFKGRTGITATIDVYDNATQNNRVDGQYRVTLSRSTLAFDNTPATLSIDVTSTDPRGVDWTLTDAANPKPEWITAIDLTPGASDADATLGRHYALDVRAAEWTGGTAGQTREWAFYITSGNMRYKVKCVQTVP